MIEDDEIEWADESADAAESQTKGTTASSASAPTDAPDGSPAPLDILIVDDDEDVHRVTVFTLNDLKVDGQPVRFHHAYNSDEARALLMKGPRFCVILLDVVMEDEASGFRLVKYIRNELGEKASRIIMRTGQPGSVPERDLILEYDINDYRNKTELTAMTLFTAVVTASRTYLDIVRLQANSEGLGRVMDHAKELFSEQHAATPYELLSLACQHFEAHVGSEASVSVYRLTSAEEPIQIIGTETDHALVMDVEFSRSAFVQGEALFLGVEYCDTKYLLCARESVSLTEDLNRLLELLRKNLQTAMDNINLRDRLQSLQVNLRRFVPTEALELFKVQDVRGLEMGYSFELNACIVFMRLDSTVDEDSPTVARGMSDVVQIILNNHGLVDKFTTDGLLAIFFKPETAGHDALTAIADIQSVLHNESLGYGKHDFDFGFGVNFGKVTFGLVGYEERLELTVMGDPVNIAARIKSICRTLPCSALVSRSVVDQYRLDDLALRNLGNFQLRGRQESIDCFEFFGGLSQLDIERYKDYRHDFEKAVAALNCEQPNLVPIRELAKQFPQDEMVAYLAKYVGQRAPHGFSRMMDTAL